MIIEGNTRLVGLFGHPVEHSLSPRMMNPAFAKAGLPYAYVPLPTQPEQLEIGVKALRTFNFIGANVTIPFKSQIIPFLDEISDLSRQTGTVNTIVNDQGKLKGTTTDPEGFIRNFHESGASFAEKSVAILGTGGTARSILFALCLLDKPKNIFIVGRNPDKVTQMVKEIKNNLHPKPVGVSLEHFPRIQDSVEIIVNATSVGMSPYADQCLLDPNQLKGAQAIYDVVYAPEKTELLKRGERLGIPCVGGLGMLVYQGIASFKIWTGLEPDPQDFFDNIRQALAGRAAA